MPNAALQLESSVEFVDPIDPSRRVLGTLCRINNQTGFCCVQFVDIGCRKVHRSHLVPSTQQGPSCTDDCRQGC